MERKELLATAVAVGLVLGVDFEKNISNANLQKKIDEKIAQNEADLKDVDFDTPPTDKEKEDAATTLKMLNEDNSNDGLDNTDNNPSKEETNLQKKIDELEEEVEEEKVVIQRLSKCGAYKLKFVNGYEHCAARNKITVEQLKEAIETGKEVNGFTYKLI